MKIMVIGYSGSGKSTLARKLAEKHGIPVMHLDAVHFSAGWRERSAEEKLCDVENFLNENNSWVIDGTYTKLFYDRRTEEADMIIMLLFNRFTCLKRAYRRYKKYKGLTRPDMAEGCDEKFDAEFASWILYGGRKKKTRDRYKELAEKYPDKTVIINNQRQLTRFEKENNIL